MSAPLWQQRYDAGLPVWWPTHDVWLYRNRWYTGDRAHRYGGFGTTYVEGLPVDDESEAAYDTAARLLGAMVKP